MDITKNLGPLIAALDALKVEVDRVKSDLASDDIAVWRNAVAECGGGLQAQVNAVRAAANGAISVSGNPPQR